MLSSKGPIEENASPRDDLIRVFAHYADRVLSYMILYSPKGLFTPRSLLPIVKSFKQFIECVKIRQWLERFYKMDRTEKDLKQRNEYISYLVVQMQNGKVGQPFNKNPPSITRTLVDLNVALVNTIPFTCLSQIEYFLRFQMNIRTL